MIKFFLDIKWKVLSWGYRCIRMWAIKFYKVYRKEHYDLEEVSEWGDKNLLAFYKVRPQIFHFPRLDNQETYLYDLKFKSPFIVSAFKDNPRLLRLWIDMGMGGAIVKTVRYHVHKGNERPRLASFQGSDGKESFLNALGLPTAGIVETISRFKKEGWVPFTPLGWSMNGNDPADTLRVHNVLMKEKRALGAPFFMEINISCPNIDERKGNLIESVDFMLSKMRQKSDDIIGIKVSPDMDDELLKAIAFKLKDFSRVYINAGNTQKVEVKTYLKNGELVRAQAGLSGHHIFKRTLEMLRLLRPYDIPMVATGGIRTEKDIEKCQKEGALLIGMATALVQDPFRSVMGNLICKIKK